MVVLLSQTAGWVYCDVHYKERWSPSNGCNRGTFVLAVSSCWSSDEVIPAHFLITTLPRCSHRDWLSECPGETHLAAPETPWGKTREGKVQRCWIENRSGGGRGAISWWGQNAAVIYARWHLSCCCCWDYTQLAAGRQLQMNSVPFLDSMV